MRSRVVPFSSLLVLLLHAPLFAAVVRGRVTTALGRPAPGARVQLIRLAGGAQNVAAVIAGLDGSFELRTDLSGRFLLLTTPSLLSAHLQPQLGRPFYAGRTDLVRQDISLGDMDVTPQTSALQTGREQPLAQLAATEQQVRADTLESLADVVPALRAEPAVHLVQQGATGAPAELYLRGAPPADLQVRLDGVSVEDLGGGFDLATLGTVGLAAREPIPALELAAGPFPLGLTDAAAGLLDIHSAAATSMRPSVVYAGDAGSLGTLRQQLTVAATPRRADLQATFGRFNTGNEQPADPYHLVTAATRLEYRISAGTALRFTARRDVSAGPEPLPALLLGQQPTGRLAQQNLYGTAAFDTRTEGNWHNSFTYGLVRKRLQSVAATATAGQPVTIIGANGYTATGTAAYPALPAREDAVNDRDEFLVQSDRPIKPWLTPLLRLRFENERGADITAAQKLSADRHHLGGALALTGTLLHQRLFYEAAGDLDHSPLLGFTGSPRLGLTYVPVEPGTRRFRGTALHATVATGSREPSLLEQAATLHPVAPRSRAFSVSVDQTILPGRLFLHGGYFHQQFAHEFEFIAFRVPSQTLAFRAQGLESELHYAPTAHLRLRGGYTFLAALVEQSAAPQSFNPTLPGLPIGAYTALRGARPFERPPNSGFAAAEYAGRLLSASVRASVTGRSDDSTRLGQTPTLLLPNRNLSPGYTAMDASASLIVTRHITVYTELNNLFNNRRMAPIGFLSAPFVARAGARLRFGGE